MANTIAFPSTLRKDIDDGTANHVSFQIIGGGLDEDLFKIHMYIPQGFSLGDTATFGSIDLGVINATKSLINNSKEEKNEADAEDIAIGASVMKNLGLDIGGSADAALVDQGIAINNQTTLTFEGSSIRTFNFSFILVAQSEAEARLAKTIEHTFRKYMYAKKEGEFAIKYPPIFRIKFLSGDEINTNMPKLFDSYLTGLTAAYNTQGGNMFHADGSPTDIQLDLAFQEQKQLTRSDLYDLEDVAPGSVQQDFTYPEQKTSNGQPRGG